MRKITNYSFLWFAFFVLFGHNQIEAQVLLKEVPLEAQIENSDLVVEGKVVAKQAVWDNNTALIYTINTIEVYKVFKGEPLPTIDVVTVGGVVGLKALVAHPSLTLRKGDVGVFALEQNTTSFSKSVNAKTKKFNPYGLTQGFYKYNVIENKALTPFVTKHDITGSFYKEIEQLTKTNRVDVKPFDVAALTKKNMTSKGVMIPGPITLNRTEVTAGTGDLLTITGTNFGTIQGKVKFRNADDGGGSFIDALDSQVVSWEDDEIIVEVPSAAGTGTVRVQDSENGLSPESSVLTVLYAEINVETDPDDQTGSGGTNGPIPFSAYQLQHIRENVSGGYTWSMQTDFFNDSDFPGAKDAFLRSFNKWICETGINWTIADTPTIKDAVGDSGDGVNVIRFDNGNELDSNTLGICYSWYSGCFNGLGGVDWFVDELDIVFNDDINWYTGTGTPSSGQYDLESVALHELGHGHQLGHVIDPNNNSIGNNAEDVMHYSFSNGETQRAISVNNSTAANAIQDRSTGAAVCSRLIMTDLACPLGVNDLVLDSGLSLYPNPVNQQLHIKNASYLTLKSAALFDVSGRKVVEFDLSEGSKLNTVDVSSVSAGVYFVEITAEDASVTRKLVIE